MSTRGAGGHGSSCALAAVTRVPASARICSDRSAFIRSLMRFRFMCVAPHSQRSVDTQRVLPLSESQAFEVENDQIRVEERDLVNCLAPVAGFRANNLIGNTLKHEFDRNSAQERCHRQPECASA